MADIQRQTFLYIVKCRDGSYYTGVTINVAKRIDQHNSGKGAKYTRGRSPVKLAYFEICDSLSVALKRENEIKRWERARKEELVLSKPWARNSMASKKQCYE